MNIEQKIAFVSSDLFGDEAQLQDSPANEAAQQQQPKQVPLFPPEIFAKVLQNLEFNDLLKCRLVCRSWNDESLAIINKYHATDDAKIKLNGVGRIWDYIDYAKKQFPALVVPLHISVGIYRELTEGEDELRLLTHGIPTLKSMFGSECIAGLSVRNSIPETPVKFHILGKVAQGLKCLELENWSSNAELLNAQENLVKFPLLKQLKCRTCMSLEPNPRARGYCRAIMYFPKSPNLDHLEICCWNFRALPRQFDFTSLKTLSIGYLGRPSSLLIAVDPRQFLNDAYYKLQKLEIHSLSDEMDNGSIRGILFALSCELKSLKIPVGPRRQVFSSPLLPALTHLSFPYDSPGWINLPTFGFTPRSLPALKSIDIPTGYFLESEVFPGVTHITLRVGDITFNNSWYSEWHHSIRMDPASRNLPRCTDSTLIGFLKSISNSFPNARSFCVLSECKTGEDQVKHLIKAILEHAPIAHQLQELKVQSCDQNYVGQVLSENWSLTTRILENLKANGFSKCRWAEDNAVHINQAAQLDDEIVFPILKNLQKLTLEQRTNTFCLKTNMAETYGGIDSLQARELYLAAIDTFCPNIKVVEIGLALLWGGKYDFQSAEQKAGEIKKRFPTWEVSII